MSQQKGQWLFGRCLGTALFLGTVCWLSVNDVLHAQVIFNEGNAVSSTEGTGFLAIDPNKPYEGYDYGSFPFSENTNLPNEVVEPGNPFPPDVSSAGGTQTSFVDGFDVNTNPRGFARIQYNGGEWIELVITSDHADLRGYSFLWVDDFDDDGIFGELQSQDSSLLENERGAVTFSNDRAWANLRAGTIITISESQTADEIRDDYPYGFPNTGVDDTGFDYDLSTDASFEVFDGNDDWHVHFHLDESVTQGAAPADTQYFRAHSDLEVSNEQWAGKITDATNNTIETIQDPARSIGQLDFETGEVTEFIGENDSIFVSNFGTQAAGGGVGDDETLALLSDPDSVDPNTQAWEVSAAFFEDLDWSTFGQPNLFNMRTDVNDIDGDGQIERDIVLGASEDDTTLSQVQDFSGLRGAVRENTYDWISAGIADFANAANWQRANDNATTGVGPGAVWTTRLMNDSGDALVAQVASHATIKFASIMATSGSMTLEVQAGATLSVVGVSTEYFETPGRVMVMDGGILQSDGITDAAVVEGFMGAIVTGTGSVTGDLINSGGTVQPGSGSGGTLSIGGNFVQDADGTLAIDFTGTGEDTFGLLSVEGSATLDGFLDVTLNGFTPTNGSAFTVLTSSALADLGLTLTGDTNGFSFSIVGGTDLVLSFTGSIVDPDFSGNGELDCADIDMLTAEIVAMTDNSNFDLNGDGDVDLADRDEWLTLAGEENLTSGNPYLLGDANLDGVVDGQDFIEWNDNKFTKIAAWCAGDFNADGVVDGQDFIAWNDNKFMSADGNSIAVPETSTYATLALVGLSMILRRRVT